MVVCRHRPLSYRVCDVHIQCMIESEIAFYIVFSSCYKGIHNCEVVSMMQTLCFALCIFLKTEDESPYLQTSAEDRENGNHKQSILQTDFPNRFFLSCRFGKVSSFNHEP